MMTRALVLAVAMGVMCVCASGQNIVFTQGTVGSGLENTIQVPLRTYPGRGSASMSVNLTYSSRVWRIGPITTILNNQWIKYQTITEAIYSEYAVAGWKSSIDLPIVEWPRNDDTYYYTGKPFCHVCGSNLRQFRVARVYIILPDGSKHELRKSDQPYEGAIDMVGTFYAVDGSRLRYDSTGQSTGTLYFPDGTRYVLAGGTAQLIDRNGNTLNYNASNRQWTDTLGRVINLPLPASPTVGEQLYYLPGMPLPYKFIWKRLSDSGVLTPLPGGGTPTRKPIANEYLPNPSAPPTPPSGNNFPVTIQPSYTEIPSLFISDFMDDDDLGPQTIVVGRGQVQAALFDPVVLTEIVLPNNLSYKFSYNIYGEMDKVVYPTGAFERYTYSQIPVIGDVKAPYTQSSRGVTLRQVSANGTGSDLVDWVYASTGTKITITPPLNGAVTETYRRWYATPEHQGTQGTISKYWPFGFEDSRQGEIYEERAYASGVGGAMLRRTLKEFDQTANTVQPSIPQLDNTTKTAYRNPRQVKEVSLMLDTGGDALAKTITYEYDPILTYQLTTGLELIATNERYFASVDQATAQAGTIDSMPFGTLASRSETTLLDDVAYRNRHILSLPTLAVLKDSGLQVVAKTEFLYDQSEYAPPAAYPDLSSFNWIDPGTPVRGNVTTVRPYYDIAAGLYLETHAQFDQCGNNISSWNERGKQFQVEFSATYKYAYATGTATPIPDPTGAHGSNAAFTTSTVYDSTTGLVTSNTDVNGQTTTYSYQDDFAVTDPLKRLRKVTRPDGSWVKTDYNDVVGNLFVSTETKLDDTRTTVTYQYADPMGRNSRAFTSVGGLDYIAIDTLYDGLGRVWKSSNPYRTTQRDAVALEAHTNDWTTKRYEALSRVDLLTLPDTSTVQTIYEGASTTVIDQAGRRIRQLTDALGRIVRVDEADSSGNLGPLNAPLQPTSYEYNTSGNLIHVIQNAQHRYFRYDAMGRLTHERQVEPLATPFTTNDAQTAANPTTNTVWTRRLIYDETLFGTSYKGLLTGMYDARQVLSQSLYDNLNRPISITYSDGVTPAVDNYYDVFTFNVSGDNRAVKNKGRLAEVRTAALGSVPATSQLTNYDLMGRVIQSQQNVGPNSYTFRYFYNAVGSLTTEIYPSGRTVNLEYDAASRLSRVSSGPTNYADQFVYGDQGALTSFTFGNGAVQSFGYNSRLQLISLDLTKAGTQIQRYNYKYGVYNPNTDNVDQSKNNGDIAEIEGFIGSVKQWQQRFTYDSVGRLATAREKRGDNSQQSYLVKYDYDVYGNRFQYQAQNPGNPFPQIWVESGQISASTNRFTSGLTYDNAGNVTTDSKFHNKQFQYDANNRQRWSANLDGSGAETTVFDGLGQRLATLVNGTIAGISVYDAMGTLVAEYGSSTMNGTQYLVSDQQATPRVVTSASGTVISRHDYLPFGEELSAGVGMRSTGQGYGGNDGIQKKYTGMETDIATGLFHTLWRKYDQLSGRWTTTDPYSSSMTVTDPQSFNRYTYVNNDPVNTVDPLGLALADIGVYQTEDPRQAKLAEQRSLLEFRQAINSTHEEEQDPPGETPQESPFEFGSLAADFEFEQQESPNIMTATNGNPEDEAIDKDLGEIFTDGTGIVRGAGAYRNLVGGDTHFRLKDGTVHTLHIFGDAAGEKLGAVYIPKEFSDISYAGGGTVIAKNPKTGEVIAASHIDVKSRKQLEKNLKEPPNAKGSRFIGRVGGPGGEGVNDTHAHLSIYPSSQSRAEALKFKGDQNKRFADYNSSIKQHLGDFRNLVRK